MFASALCFQSTSRYLSVQGPSLSPHGSVELGGCSALRTLLCRRILRAAGQWVWGLGELGTLFCANLWGMLCISRLAGALPAACCCSFRVFGVLACALVSLTRSLDEQCSSRCGEARCETAQKRRVLQNADFVHACSLGDINHSLFCVCAELLSMLAAAIG